MSERLTQRVDDGIRYDNGKYIVTCYPKNNNLTPVDKLAAKLCEFEDKIENGTLITLPCKVGDKVYLVLWSHVVSAKVEYILSSITESEIAHQMYVVIIDGYHAGEKKTAMLHDDPNVENHNVCKAYKDRETAEKVCEEIRFATATTTWDERHPNKTGWEGFCSGY